MAVSLQGFNEQVATFAKQGVIQKGDLVTIFDNNTVTSCINGNIPCGVCVNIKGDEVGVLLSGYVEVTYTSNKPELGENSFIAGGAKKVIVSPTGKKALVVYVDEETSTVGFIL